MYLSNRFIFLFTILLLSFGTYSQKTTTVWKDDLKTQTFSERIASVVPIKPTSSDSIKRNVGVEPMTNL